MGRKNKNAGCYTSKKRPKHYNEFYKRNREKEIQEIVKKILPQDKPRN